MDIFPFEQQADGWIFFKQQADVCHVFFLKNNRQMFKGPVHDPIMLCLQVINVDQWNFYKNFLMSWSNWQLKFPAAKFCWLLQIYLNIFLKIWSWFVQCIQWNPDPANTFRIRSPWIRRGSGFAETGSGSRGPLNPVPDPKHWFWQTVRIRIQIYGCIRIRIKHKRSRNAGCFLFVSHHYWRVSMDPDPHWSPMRNLVSNFNYANLNYRFFLNII